MLLEFPMEFTSSDRPVPTIGSRRRKLAMSHIFAETRQVVAGVPSFKGEFVFTSDVLYYVAQACLERKSDRLVTPGSRSWRRGRETLWRIAWTGCRLCED